MIKPEDLRIGDIVKVNEIGCALHKNAIFKVVGIRSKHYNTTEKDLEEVLNLLMLMGLTRIVATAHTVFGARALTRYSSLSNSSKRTTLKKSSIKRKALRNGTTSTITTSALMSCTRSRGISLPPTLTAKSYEKLNTLTNSNISFGRWA